MSPVIFNVSYHFSGYSETETETEIEHPSHPEDRIKPNVNFIVASNLPFFPYTLKYGVKYVAFSNFYSIQGIHILYVNYMHNK